jgi:hypothetical protein
MAFDNAKTERCFFGSTFFPHISLSRRNRHRARSLAGGRKMQFPRSQEIDMRITYP